jgi:hypothetical protein
VKAWHQGFDGAVSFGKKWDVGDVVGVAVDMDVKTMSFALNDDWSTPMGVAWSHFEYNEYLCPSITYMGAFRGCVHFGAPLGPGAIVGEEELTHVGKWSTSMAWRHCYFQVLFNAGVGYIVALWVKPSDFVGDVKVALALKIKERHWNIRLHFAGKDLKDGLRVLDYGVRKGSTVEVLKRMLGGARYLFCEAHRGCLLTTTILQVIRKAFAHE